MSFQAQQSSLRTSASCWAYLRGEARSASIVIAQVAIALAYGLLARRRAAYIDFGDVALFFSRLVEHIETAVSSCLNCTVIPDLREREAHTEFEALTQCNAIAM